MDSNDLVACGRLFSRLDALEAGWSERQIDRRLANGTWRRVRDGLYVVDGPEGATDHDQLILELRAAQARIPGSVASHHTAAAVWRLSLFGPTGLLTVTTEAADGRTPSAYPGLAVQVAGLPAEDVCSLDGVLVTSLARTVADRARTSSFRAGVVTADAALRAGLERQALQDVLDRCRRWPGKLRAVEVAKFADPRAESVLESISRVFARERDLPVPIPQAEIRDDMGRFVARTDLLWDEQRVAGEADGDVKYTDPYESKGETPLLSEKRRQEDIEAQGLLVVRWNLDGILRRGGVTEQRIREAFRRSARLHLPNPPDWPPDQAANGGFGG